VNATGAIQDFEVFAAGKTAPHAASSVSREDSAAVVCICASTLAAVGAFAWQQLRRRPNSEVVASPDAEVLLAGYQ